MDNKRDDMEPFDEEQQEQLKKHMQDFHEWRLRQVEDLDEEKAEKAREICDNLRDKGFWMTDDSIIDLHIMHGLSLDRIEDDLVSVIEEVKDE